MRYIVILFLILSTSLKAQTNADYAEKLKRGKDILSENVEQVDLALSYFLAAKKSVYRPKTALYYQIGLCYLIKKSDQGVEYFEAILDPVYKAPEILPYLLAESYQLKEDYVKAKFYYWQFLRNVEKKSLVRGMKLDPITAFHISGDRHALGMRSFKLENLIDEIFFRVSECDRAIIAMEEECLYAVVDSSVAWNSVRGDYNAVKHPSLNWFAISRKVKNKTAKPDDPNRYHEDIEIVSPDESITLPDPKPLNSKKDERVLFFDEEKDALYFRRSTKDKGYDLYKSYLLGGGEWSRPVRLSRKINTEADETSIFVFDQGKKAYFTSSRLDSKGGTDVYYIEKDENDQWGEAENLGDSVNTEFNEDGVYYDSRFNKLYFSSEGHNSIGGLDIYQISYDPGFEEWTKCENLGYPINTSNHENYFKFINIYQDGMFVSDRSGGMGDYDIYLGWLKDKNELKKILDRQIGVEESDTGIVVTVSELGKKTPKTIIEKEENKRRPTIEIEEADDIVLMEDEDLYETTPLKDPAVLDLSPVKIIGNVQNKSSFIPVAASLLFFNEEGIQIAEAPTHPNTGEFLVELKFTGILKVEVRAKGYKTKMEQFVIADSDRGASKEFVVNLESDGEDKPFVLKDLNFEHGKWDLEGKNIEILDELVHYLKANPSVKIKIYGHADIDEGGAKTEGISTNRSWGVKQYLMGKGIHKTRLISFGYSDKKPLTEGRLESEKARNRRVNFRIIAY